LLERALCLHRDLYRRLLPTINNRNIKKYGGLQNLLQRMRPGELIFAHLHFSANYKDVLKDHDVHTLFMIRDPRDIVLSQCNYLMYSRNHPLHRRFASESDMSGRLRLAICGEPELNIPSIADRLRKYEGWLDSAGLVVRFEELVGGQEQDLRTGQRQILFRIFNFLNLSVDDDIRNTIISGLAIPVSPTFYRGKTGQWMKHFTPGIEELFMQTTEELMECYGYAGIHAGV